MTRTWTHDELGIKRTKTTTKYYAYPRVTRRDIEGVTVYVESEDPEDVCRVANAIENATPEEYARHE